MTGAGDSGPAMDVEDLEVYRRAYQVSLAVHRASLGFPPIEQRALADQLRRASKSICANLAEGFGRRGHAPADFRRFVVMGIGSADEMRVWLRYARDLGYVEPAQVAAKWERMWDGHNNQEVGLEAAIL